MGVSAIVPILGHVLKFIIKYWDIIKNWVKATIKWLKDKVKEKLQGKKNGRVVLASTPVLKKAVMDMANTNVYSLDDLQETVDKAQKILQKAFGNWITSIEIPTAHPSYSFGDDSYFINFNYTDTLEKRFGVKEENDYHIHGEATDPEDIIFGHSSHPEMAFPELMEQKFITTFSGGKSKRLQGLYLLEAALYDTDKNVQDNIDDLCEFMTLDGVHIEDITDIYVLGHSLAEVDYEYFEFLVKAAQTGCDFNELSALWKVRNLGLENLDDDSLM